MSRQRRAAHSVTKNDQLMTVINEVQQCKLTILETRRVLGDQIEDFKITHGIEGFDSGMIFLI